MVTFLATPIYSKILVVLILIRCVYKKREIYNLFNQVIYSITIKNNNNYEITFNNFGGYVHSVKIPYKNEPNKFEDVILGYDDFNQCLEAPDYFNSIIGRVSNRISNSKFILNNSLYQVSNNDGDNHLHGGREGFNKKFGLLIILVKTIKR